MDDDTARRGSAPEARLVAGWGDDPVLAELMQAIDNGYEVQEISEDSETAGGPYDVVVVRKGDEALTFKSDHLAFHRYVEGLQEDLGL